ncbi:MAG: Hsp20/alpha crystallin family protein [Lautropia sp.]
MRERFGHGYGGRFGGRFPGRHQGRHGGANQPPVDIEDTRDAFVLSLFASGLDKQRVHIGVRDDLLTIRYTAPAEVDESGRRFTRRESWSADFVREFALNGKVLVEAMSASYADGVLTIRLPKTPEAMQPEHTVVIA